MAVTGKFVYIWLAISSCYGSIPLTLGLIGMDGNLSTLVSQLRVCLSAECSKNVSQPWLSLLREWGSLTMTFTGKFVYIWLTSSTCYGSIRLTLGLIEMDSGLSTLVSQLWVCLSAEGSKNVSWPWLSPLRGWCCLTIAFTGKFVYIWLTISSCCGSIPLTLGLIGRDGSLSTLVLKLWVCLSAEGAENVSWPWISPLRGWGSLTMTFTGIFVYIWLTISTCYGSIPLTLGLIGRNGVLSTLVSQLQVCLSAEDGKNFSWPRLSPLRGWCCLTMAFTGKFVCIYIYIILYIYIYYIHIYIQKKDRRLLLIQDQYNSIIM